MPRARADTTVESVQTAETAKNVETVKSILSRNEVTLCGRVAAPAEARELPSGDCLVTARIIVDRDPAALGHSKQRVDTLDCVAWQRRPQRNLLGWAAGDTVLVEGAIRRRFYRGSAGAVSRVEVEVRRAKRVKNATSRIHRESCA